MDERIVSAAAYPGVVSENVSSSAVSWAAIVAGAVVAAAASLLLSVLATGIDLAAVSPWPGTGVSATSVAVMTAIALIAIQWISALLGGYMTGRLRTRWIGTHTHEVFFRDTAHGFIAWALATLLVASVVASAGSSLIGATFHGVSSAAAGITSTATTATAASRSTGSIAGYDLDTLFRSTSTDSHPGAPNDSRAQSERILAKGLATGDVPAADRTYLAQLVAAQAGISPDDAQRRVDDVISQVKAAELKAREAADQARKGAALTSILAALSMLVGAFIASVSAALGGRLRDLHP